MKTLYSNLSKGWANRRQKAVWYLKQLLPLTYWTKYRGQEGEQHFCVWRMWFGRCFNVTDVVVQTN